jgi:hypothetical protein
MCSERVMILGRRTVLTAIAVGPFVVGPLQAQNSDSRLSWDGRWSGYWGGQESHETTVMIANNKVVSFEYHGVVTPVADSTVTPTTISYEHNWVTVTINRVSGATAMASLHSMMGDAKLTKR